MVRSNIVEVPFHYLNLPTTAFNDFSYVNRFDLKSYILEQDYNRYLNNEPLFYHNSLTHYYISSLLFKNNNYLSAVYWVDYKTHPYFHLARSYPSLSPKIHIVNRTFSHFYEVGTFGFDDPLFINKYSYNLSNSTFRYDDRFEVYKPNWIQSRADKVSVNMNLGVDWANDITGIEKSRFSCFNKILPVIKVEKLNNSKRCAYELSKNSSGIKQFNIRGAKNFIIYKSKYLNKIIEYDPIKDLKSTRF